MVSGDLSIIPQRTVDPARLPALSRPDLVILESTYGARAHPNRQAEETRLVQTVVKHLQHGHVLIPAFALGRAQEIILILPAAQARGQAPLFPIFGTMPTGRTGPARARPEMSLGLIIQYSVDQVA